MMIFRASFGAGAALAALMSLGGCGGGHGGYGGAGYDSVGADVRVAKTQAGTKTLFSGRKETDLGTPSGSGRVLRREAVVSDEPFPTLDEYQALSVERPYY